MQQDKDYASNKEIKIGDYVKSTEEVYQQSPKATRDSMELANRNDVTEEEDRELQRIHLRASGRVKRTVKGRVIHIVEDHPGGLAIIRTASGEVEHVSVPSCEVIDAPQPKPADAAQIEMFGD